MLAIIDVRIVLRQRGIRQGVIRHGSLKTMFKTSC